MAIPITNYALVIAAFLPNMQIYNQVYVYQYVLAPCSQIQQPKSVLLFAPSATLAKIILVSLIALLAMLILLLKFAN